LKNIRTRSSQSILCYASRGSICRCIFLGDDHLCSDVHGYGFKRSRPLSCFWWFCKNFIRHTLLLFSSVSKYRNRSLQWENFAIGRRWSMSAVDVANNTLLSFARTFSMMVTTTEWYIAEEVDKATVRHERKINMSCYQTKTQRTATTILFYAEDTAIHCGPNFIVQSTEL